MGEREKLPLARLNVVRLAPSYSALAAPSGETGEGGGRSSAGLCVGPAGHATGGMSADGAVLECKVRGNLPLRARRSLTGVPRRSRAPAHPVMRLPLAAGVVKHTVPPPRWRAAVRQVLVVLCRCGGLGSGFSGLRALLGGKHFSIVARAGRSSAMGRHGAIMMISFCSSNAYSYCRASII